MAFEGDQNTMANTLFPIYQRQTGLNIGCGNNGNVPFISIPSVSLQETDPGSYIPWSQNAHDDPYELVNCSQNHIKNRKPSDIIDDGETELQGLVSNILDEANSQDSFYSDGSLSQQNNIWSPKIQRDELLQYFQSDAKTQYNLAPNYTSHDAFGKMQGHVVDKEAEVLSQPNGFSTNQHLLFNLPNGVRDSCTQQHGLQKTPPGLPAPNMANTYLSQLQQNNYDNVLASKDRGSSEPTANFPDFRNVFRPQSDANSGDLFYGHHYNQGMDKPVSNDQYTTQDLNQLVSSFQSFVAGEQDSSEFPNVTMATTRMQQEDNMADKWRSPFTPARGNSLGQMPRQMGADFVQRERNGSTKKQLFKRDALQDLSAFTMQNTDYSPQSKVPIGNQQHTKMFLQTENALFNMNQYSKPPQSPLRIKPQMQKEKKRIAGFLGDSFSARPLTNREILPEEKRPALAQKPFFDLPFSTRPQRFDRENNMVATVHTQQFMPLVYPGTDSRRHPSFSPRSPHAYGSGMEMGDMMSTNEMAGFNPNLNEMMSRRGDNTYHGMTSALSPPMAMNQGGPVIQLYFYLDECYEQWRCLEKERKRTEIVLTKTFLGKRATTFSNSSLPKSPSNPTRVDHLIVNQMREQARVSSLLDKMECLSSVPLNANIYTALNKHHMAVCVTSSRRKEEIANMSQNQRQRVHFTEERDTMLLVIALKDLAVTTRKLRTAVWCALQLTLPKPVNKPEPQPDSDDKETEKCPSPFEGYSFKL